MNKKLTAKVQALKPSFKGSVAEFSGCVTIEPEEREDLLKKGSLYVVFDVSGNTSFDPNIVSKVVHDILKNSYYNSDSVSPIQSLEKAILEVKENILHLADESIGVKEQKVEFNVSTVVLWGNVLYLAKYGKGHSFLMREGTTKEIDTAGEGGFSSASGVIKDEDVVILCTHDFGLKFPPAKLLTLSLSEQQLAEKEACMLLKFIVDMSFTEDEVVDFGLQTKQEQKKFGSVISTFLSSFKKIKIPKLPKKISREEKVTSLVPRTAVTFKPIRLPRANVRFNWKFRPVYLIPFVLAALVTSVVFTLGRKKQETPTEVKSEQSQQEKIIAIEQPKLETPAQPSSQIFYDLKITDPSVSTNEIMSFSDKVVVSDKTLGKIYVSSISTPKFESLTTSFIGVSHLVNSEGKLAFTDGEGYKVYDLSKSEVLEKYTVSNLGINDTYLGYIYSVEGDKVVKYTKSGDSLVSSVWGQSPDFEGARSMSVAYSVYVITSKGELVSYTMGKKDPLSLTGLESPLGEAFKVVASVNFRNIYIGDRLGKRVVAFDKTGKFVKEYKDIWEDFKDFSISPDEKKIYVLSGAKVYELNQ